MRLAGAAIALVMPTQGLAANAPDHSTYEFALNAGALEQSLKSLSDTTGVSLVYDARVVSGRTAPPLSGALTTRDALEELLDGSPLEYREIDGLTLAIVRRAPVVELLPEDTGIAYIEQDPQTRIDEIIVTASYRAPGHHGGLRIDYALDSEALELSGAQNVAEPIHDLPATVASVSSANTALLVSAGGLNLADLRGLAPERTLVLVNGRRFVRTSGGNGTIYGVDLNAIPTAFIDRVEVINQGAGPMLGTDAVSGAVNLVTRDHIDGLSLSASGGISGRGDAKEYSFSAFAGTPFANERGKISAGVVYATDPSLFFEDRDYLAQPYGFALDGRRSDAENGVFTPGFGGSTFTPAGSISAVIADDGHVRFIEPVSLTDGGFETFEGRLDQLYNWVEGFAALPEIDRLHGYAKSNYELSPAVSLYGELIFAHIDTRGSIAPTPAGIFRGADRRSGDAIVVPSDHPDTPAGLRNAIEANIGVPVESFLINRRYVESGPRLRDFNRRTFQFAAGLEANLGGDWSLNADYQFGRSRILDRALGVPDGGRVAIAVSPSLCAMTPGCSPLSVFSGANASAQAGAFYTLPPQERRIVTSEHAARVTASGPIYELGGRAGLMSVGGEFRRNNLHDRGPVVPPGVFPLGEFNVRGSEGSVTYSEIFAGVDLPFTRSESGLGVIELGVDGRLTRWSGGGFVSNFSADLSWTPTPGVELYAFALKGGRAPNVIELFSNDLDTRFIFFDPCNGPVDNALDNCASPGPLGVPPGFEQENLLVDSLTFGNSNLDNEDIHSRHFGIAADVQEFIYLGDNALRITADWRFHRIDNQIVGSQALEPLDECYKSESLSSIFCGANPATGRPFVQRDPVNGQLNLIESTYLNRAASRTSGLDASLAYRGDLFWAPFSPSLSVDVLYSYTHRMDYRKSPLEAFENEAGLVNFPRHQLYTTAALETERYKTLWTIRRRGEARSVAGAEDVTETRLPAMTYVDAAFQFRPSDNVVLYAGVENLFDKDLPVAAFAERGFYAEYYDVIGRRYFAGVRAEF